jgi:hypothetical protein
VQKQDQIGLNQSCRSMPIFVSKYVFDQKMKNVFFSKKRQKHSFLQGNLKKAVLGLGWIKLVIFPDE